MTLLSRRCLHKSPTSTGGSTFLVNNAAKLVGDNGPRFVLAKAVGLEGADMLLVGLRSHFVASYYAAPLLIANGRGLIVNTGHYGAVSTWQKSFVRIV